MTANTLTTMKQMPDVIELRLQGEKVADGIALLDLQRFLQHFVGALRGFDRVQRAKPAIKSGHPARRDEEVAGFRLVDARRGSAVLRLEPDIPADDATHFDAGGPALDNLTQLTRAFADGRQVDGDVADSLEQARRSVGANSGTIELRLPERLDLPRVILDRERIDRARSAPRVAESVSRISGRLHLIDLEPDRVGVRSPQGVDWTCEFHESLKDTVKHLIDEIVIVEGEGELTTSKTGRMVVDAIRRAVDHEQPALFTSEWVDPREVAASQAVSSPQGLSVLADTEWGHDEEDDRFLDYVLGRS